MSEGRRKEWANSSLLRLPVRSTTLMKFNRVFTEEKSKII